MQFQDSLVECNAWKCSFYWDAERNRMCSLMVSSSPQKNLFYSLVILSVAGFWEYYIGRVFSVSPLMRDQQKKELCACNKEEHMAPVGFRSILLELVTKTISSFRIMHILHIKNKKNKVKLQGWQKRVSVQRERESCRWIMQLRLFPNNGVPPWLILPHPCWSQ